MSGTVFVSKGGRADFFVGLKDLMDGLSRVELWLAFAADEVQNRYRRSRLGLVWIVISYLLFIVAISIFFGGFSKKGPADFVAHVSVNYAMFSFLTSNLTDGCAVFRSGRTWISSMTLPHSIQVLKTVARGLFVFAISMTVGLIVLCLTGHILDVKWALTLLAFLVILVNAVFIQMSLGYINARFRDVEHLIQSLTRVLFFVTPILWVRSEQPVGSMRRTLADMNPFTHALEIFTAPLLGRMPDPHSWLVMGCVTVFCFVTMIIVSWLSYRRLPYWL